MSEKKSNTSLGKGDKGSKYWIDTCLDNPIMKRHLNEHIGDQLEWISPRPEDHYREYQLKQLPQLFNDNTDLKKVFSFWPARQPQWDGIATSSEAKSTTLYLFEAKAHRKELYSICKASDNSRSLIEDSMRDVHDRYYPNSDFKFWMNGYYQLANRLVFFHRMREMNSVAFNNIKLILLNFVNDSYIPTTKDQWDSHMKQVFEVITGSKNPPTDVLCVYFDVSKYSS